MQVPSMESLEILGKLVRNVAVNPSDAKYRKLRLSNAKVQEAVGDTPGALNALLAMGWQRDEAEPDSLTFPTARQLTMAQVLESPSFGLQGSCALAAFFTAAVQLNAPVCAACSATSAAIQQRHCTSILSIRIVYV